MFLLWREIVFVSLTSCAVVSVLWLWQEIVFGVTYVLFGVTPSIILPRRNRYMEVLEKNTSLVWFFEWVLILQQAHC
jgi:hypothetical protein